MKQNLKIAILMTIVTTVLLGVIYPLVVTGLAQALFHDKANGQLLTRGGTVIGSRIIGQGFSARDTCIRGLRLRAMAMMRRIPTARSTGRPTRS